MTDDDLYALLPELERFHARFCRFFPRSESRSWSLKCLSGLTLPIERKNVDNIATLRSNEAAFWSPPLLYLEQTSSARMA